MDTRTPAAQRIGAASKQFAQLKDVDIAKPKPEDVAKRTALSNPDCEVIANSRGFPVRIVRALFPKLGKPVAVPAAKPA